MESKVLKICLFFAIIIGLGACSGSKSRYGWKTKKGTIASTTQVKKAQAKCKYNKRIEKAAGQFLTAIMIAKQKYRKKLDKKYLAKADHTMKTLNNCMGNKGLKRVKISSSLAR